MSIKSRGFDFNVVVVGGGSAGLTAAHTAASLHAKVALSEKKKMGGDCLHTGCVPSKALLRTAKICSLEHRAADLGLRAIKVEMDFPRVMARIRRVIESLAPHDSIERYQTLGVACFENEAKILSPREVVTGGKILRTRSIILATGGRPALPPIEGLAAMDPLTSDTVWNLGALPRRLLVLGGGVIGCELAQAFQRLGSQVTLVEKNSRILSREDEDVSFALQRKFESEGMRLVLGAKAISFRRDSLGSGSGSGLGEAVAGGGGEKFLDCLDGPTVPFDQVLVALGRRPNVEGLGLEQVGVRLRPNGCIETDASMRTSVKGIYACGDVTGPYQFTHFATLSGEVAARNALGVSGFGFGGGVFGFGGRGFGSGIGGGGSGSRADISVFPWGVYTDPELGRVGLSETEAKAAGIAYDLSQFDFARLDRALTDEEGSGFIKVLTVPGRDRILGVVVVGPSAGEIIQECAFAMRNGLGLRAILAAVHAYPTLMEANRSVARAWQREFVPVRGWRSSAGLHRFWRNFPW